LSKKTDTKNTAKRKPRRVCLVVDISSTYARSLLKGVSKYSQRHYNWEFETNIPFFGKQVYHPGDFLKTKTDGLIVFTNDKNMLKKALDSGIPAIVKGIDKPIPDRINFTTDNFLLAKKAYDYFRGLGLTSIAYCGLDNLGWSKNRRFALETIAAESESELIVYPTPRTKKLREWENEMPLVIEWLKGLPKPIGLLAANDFRGKEVLDACRKAGIDVPDEVAVLGVDNDECICPFTNPPLSSVSRFCEAAGYDAAKALDCLMSNKDAGTTAIIIEPNSVVVRQSTDTLAVKNMPLADAIRYIRSNASKSFTAEDVATQVGVHPRLLHEQFKKEIGHSVHDEIRKVRVDKIAEMLLETDLTIYQIAYDLNLKSPDQIARYFRKQKGMIPSEFREKYKH
jgi:LacI family transcriptional regulator